MQPPPVNPYAPPAASLETAPGGPHAPASGEYQPLFGRATAVTVTLVLDIVLKVAVAASSLMAISILSQLPAGQEVDLAIVEGIQQRAGVLAVLQVPVSLGAIISFCMLVHRANRNAASYGQMLLESSPGWAVGWFFVPILSWWKPYQAVREIWRASEPNPHEHIDVRFAEVPGLLPAWWAAFVLHVIGGQVSYQSSKTLQTASDFLTVSYVHLVGSVVTTVAAVLAIVLARALARRQDACQKAAEAFRAARRAASPA